MAPPAPAPTQSIAELLELLGQSDSVEFKLTVPETDQRSSAMALGMDPLDAEIRQAVFFDTPDLALDRAGLVVRARRVTRAATSSSSCGRSSRATLPKKLRKNPGFGVEVDAMPGKFVCSGTLKAPADNEAINRVIAGKRRSASSSPRASGRCSQARAGGRRPGLARAARPDHPRQAQVLAAPASSAGWWRRCGSSPTARASSSSRRSACRPRRARPSTSARELLAGPGRHADGRAGDEDARGAAILLEARRCAQAAKEAEEAAAASA